jgi:AcrR family transcriptional regulator
LATNYDDGVDGRTLRRQQNREAVLDALVALFAEGHYQPNAADVAERAGISLRSLFRYFEDTDDLQRAAIERLLALARPLLRVQTVPADPTALKIDRMVEARAHLFETIAPAARATRASAHRHPLIAQQLRDGRAYFRRQVRSVFAPELEAGGALLPAVDVLLSFETYELLRTDQGLSVRRCMEVLVDALGRLFAPDSRP